MDKTIDRYRWRPLLNEAHKNGTKSLHITNADVFIGASFTCSFFDGENLITKSNFLRRKTYAESLWFNYHI